MIRFMAGHPTAPNLLMVAFLVLGAIALPSLKRETFPELPLDEVQVLVVYPGASAGEVEEGVCRRVEDALDGVNDVEKVRCDAREGVATTTIEMREGGDFAALLADVRTEVEAIDDFPEIVEQPTVRALGLRDFVASVAIAGAMSSSDLKLYAERLKDRLRSNVPGIAAVSVNGFSDHQLRVEVPVQVFRQFGLSVADIAQTVGRQSVDLPVGTLEGGDRDVLLRFADERRDPAALAELVVVSGATGAAVRLGDIARITDTFEDAEDRIEFNGRRAALLRIEKGRDADTLSVIGGVRQVLAAERTASPAVELAVVQDIASIVRDRLNMLLRNGGQGLVLVLLLLVLFFTLRFSFWVAMGLPVSFAATLFAMTVLGYSLDMISMVGLLIAVGVLVDDAIVIAENVAAHAARGKAPLDAAVDGVREVAPGVLASFATTVVVFGPLVTLKGDIGNILAVFPVILIVTLTVSLVEAFLILPGHLRHAMAHAGRQRQSRLNRRVDAIVRLVRDRHVGRLIDLAVRWRYATVGIAVMLLLVSIAMIAGGVLKFRAFPDLEGNVVEARLLLPQGTPLGRTQAIVAETVAALGRVDAALAADEPTGGLVENVIVQFSRNVDAFENGAHLASITVDLVNAERRAARIDDILERWRDEVESPTDVLSLKFVDFTPGPGGRALEVRLTGDDLEELRAASDTLVDWFAAYRGVDDVIADLRPGKPEIRVRLREGALAVGLDAQAIAQQLRAAVHGVNAAEIQVGPESYEIDVRLMAAERGGPPDMDGFSLTAPDGGLVPLGAVAVLERGRGVARIHRIDGVRTATVLGEVDERIGNTADIVADTSARFLPGLAERYPGVAVSLEGQAAEAAKTGASARRALIVGLIGVFLLLSFQFRSYVEPLVVMATIPLALIGVLWGHLALGLDLSMPSVVGFVSLAGVVVNGSILLVHFARQRIAQGASVEAAVCRAGRLRFRAILLTSSTTFVGLLPLLSETSLQAQVLKPLVASLAFGMLSATLMLLFVVPSLYAVLDDFGLIRRRPAADAAEPAPA